MAQPPVYSISQELIQRFQSLAPEVSRHLSSLRQNRMQQTMEELSKHVPSIYRDRLMQGYSGSDPIRKPGVSGGGGGAAAGRGALPGGERKEGSDFDALLSAGVDETKERSLLQPFQPRRARREQVSIGTSQRLRARLQELTRTYGSKLALGEKAVDCITLALQQRLTNVFEELVQLSRHRCEEEKERLSLLPGGGGQAKITTQPRLELAEIDKREKRKAAHESSAPSSSASSVSSSSASSSSASLPSLGFGVGDLFGPAPAGAGGAGGLDFGMGGGAPAPLRVTLQDAFSFLESSSRTTKSNLLFMADKYRLPRLGR